MSELELSPPSVFGGKGGIGTVRLFDGLAPEGGTVVTIESSNPSVASVPTTVTVPGGTHYESFPITTTTVATSTAVTITASYGAVSLTNVLQVVPAPDSLVSLELSPSIVQGSRSAKATINLNGPAPVGGAVVTISSDLPVATVPASVTIPEEASSATFTITTTSVTASTTANISAVYNGLTKTSSLRVNPTALGSISVEPGDVAGGSYTSATVTLSAPAPAGGALITLESGNPSIVTVPVQVTVPAGQTFGTFVNAVATAAPSVTTSIAIRGTYEGVTSSGYVRVSPSAAPSNLYFDPSKVAGGQTSIGTVELNSPAPSGGAVVTLGTSDATLVTLPPDVTVPGGATSATFNISTSAVTSMTSVTIFATASGVGLTELLTLVPTSLEDLSLTPSGIGAGNTSTGQVTMSNPAPSGGVLVSLASSDTAVATVPSTVTVPAGATTATFSVTTAPVELSSTANIEATYGEDSQTATLTVFGANDLFATITPNGPAVTITTTNSGQNARLVFEGTAGQRVSLKMSGVTISSSYVSLLKPNGSNLTSPLYVGTGLGFLDTATLPETGTYTILIDPNGTAVGSMTLQLYDVPPDLTGGISIGGSAVTITTTAPGQNAILTFSGTAGQRVALQLSNSTFSGCIAVYDTIKKPDGTNLASTYLCGATGNIDPVLLPVTGSYTILIDPQGSPTGSQTLVLTNVPLDITGPITPGGAAVTITTTSSGQNAILTFSGTQGQRVSLKITNSTFSGCIAVYDTIKKPDGTNLSSTSLCGATGYIDTAVLPVTGNYTILIDPQGTISGSQTLVLHDVPPDVTGTITPGGPAVTITTTTPGQNAVLTFGGTQGQRASLKITGVTLTGGNGYAYIYLKKPDNSTLAQVFTLGSGFIDMQTLPTTGTYSVLVDPTGANVGSATLNLYDVPADITGPIIPGGAAVTVTTTTPGQNARLTFVGTAGQRISLKITGISLTGGNGYAYIYLKKPDNSTLAQVFTLGSGFIDVQTLPTTGTYSVLFDPTEANTGTATLTLYDVPADTTGSVSIGGSATTVAVTVPGQNARVTFSAAAGQQVTVRVTNNTMGLVTVRLLKPDGTQQTSTNSMGSSFNLATQTLSVAGTYAITIDPSGSNLGSMNVNVTSP